MANKKSISIITWVIIGLVIVAALPFLLSWYQINSSLDSIVVQTQQTHSVVAQSTATQVGAQVRVYERQLVAAGDNEKLYLQPQAEAAGQVVAETLSVINGAIAVGLFQRQNTHDIMVYSAQVAGANLNITELVASELDAKAEVLANDGKPLLRIQRQTTRPNLFLTLLVDFEQLSNSLRPAAIGDEAELLLITWDGRLLHGSSKLFDQIPQHLRDQLLTSEYDGSTSFRRGSSPIVYAYANVPSMDAKVVSIQPAKRAEQAATAMQKIAIQSFLAVSAVVLALSIGAWFLIINPIRKIIRSQRKLLDATGNQAGNEIVQLEESFKQLEEVISERDSLSEVFFDRYQILRRLGSGAMGTVYLAWDPKLRRHAALKTVKPAATMTAEQRKEMAEELVQEGVTSAALTHQNIVTIYDVTSTGGSAFIAMEYVDGESLSQRLKKEKTLSVQVVAEYAYAILRGLSVAHDRGVIHRDIKPANIMIAKDETIKISDFGIACYIQTAGEKHRLVKGTPGYLAPESLQNGVYSPQSDLFAVGVIMVQCLQGWMPFAGKNTSQVVVRTASKAVILPPHLREIVPQPMQQLIQGLLEKDPEKRIANADLALQLLRPVVAKSGDSTETQKTVPNAPIDSQGHHDDPTSNYDAATQRRAGPG